MHYKQVTASFHEFVWPSARDHLQMEIDTVISETSYFPISRNFAAAHSTNRKVAIIIILSLVLNVKQLPYNLQQPQSQADGHIINCLKIF